MTVIGRGVIEVSADSTGLNAAIDKARKSIAGLGDAGAKSSAASAKSIDAYIKKLSQQRDMLGMNTREMEAYKLAAKGASDAQLKAAAAHGRAIDQFKRGEEIGDRIKSSFRTFGAVAATSLIAAAVAVDGLIKKAGDFQDMAEKTGDTAENIASLAVAAGTAGVQMDTIVSASTKLTKNLTGVDDESKAAGAAIAALGLNIKTFKELKPADQIEEIGKALNGFEEGAAKSAVAMALFGKSGADLLPFLKELGAEGGRQAILTQQQIQQADEYADKQAKLRAEISLQAQAIATQALPAVNEFMAAISELTKDQEFAATAADLLKGAVAGGIIVFQTVAVLASDLAFVFKGVAREADALNRQFGALATFDFKEFTAISDAVTADSKKARAELDRFQERIMGIGKSPDPANYSNELRGKPGPEAPKRKALKFDGAEKKAGGAKGGGANTAAQEAKAQLARDLADIKQATAAELNIYANAEKIMEARRAANLIDDAKYYAEKLAFLQLNSQAREAESIKEIERLQSEKLSGKDKLDNDRKIAEEQGKLAKIRADAAASVEVLGVQEKAAADKIVQAYQDAREAAKAYLDTVKNQNEREIAGIGRGDKFRQEQAGRNQIEDKFTARRQDLDGDLRREQITNAQFETYLAIAKATYQAEVVEYESRTARIEAAQRDGTNGAIAALENYYDESRNIAGQVADAFTSAFDGLEDALVQFTQTGKLDFKSLISSINADIARIAIKESITGPLAGFLKDAIGGTKAPNAPGGFIEQTAAANASTIALNALTAAANSSAAALAGGRPLTVTPGSKQVIPSMGDFTRADRATGAEADRINAVADAQQDGADSAIQFGQTALAATSDVARLAAAAGVGGDALQRLPGVMGIISSIASAMSSGGGSSGGSGIESIIKLGMAAYGAYSGSGLSVDTVASGAVSADYKEMPNFLRGGRAIGGPVSAGGLYEVNEKGRPELLNVAGKQYLMMGAQGGSVDANPQTGGGGSVTHVNVNVTPPPGSNAATAQQWGAMAGRQMQRSLARNG